jgi:hypothetical protein
MIHCHRSLVVLILVILLFSPLARHAHAQQEKTGADKEEIAALREKAYKLLESVAAQLGTLQSAENRARMGSNLVDSLWKRDEERARSLLRLVQDDIKTQLQKERDRPNDYGSLDVFLKLRQDTIERVAKHDAEAALEFLRLTKPVFERPRYNFAENEIAYELRLGRQIASNNPDIALKIGRQALDQGYANGLLVLLGKLNRKHKNHGQTLYKEIVAKLRDADLSYWEARAFSQVLIQAFQPPDADELTYRELVGLFVKKGLERGCERTSIDDEEQARFCAFVASSIRDLEKYDAGVARVKHWVSEGYESQKLTLAYHEANELVEEGALDQLVEFAAKYPALQSNIYMGVIQKETAAGNFELARKLIDRIVTDPETRQGLIAYLDKEQRVRVTINETRLREIQAAFAELTNPRQRVWFLLNNANLFDDTQRTESLKMLNQANEIVDTMPPGKEQMESRLAVALMYCLKKSDRGFALMESMVPKLNELVEVAAKLDGYDTNYLRDGEWNMSGTGNLGMILTRLSRDAGYFAWYDFDRAVSLASQFERQEIRMMAHLKLAQSILAGPPKVLSRKDYSYE